MFLLARVMYCIRPYSGPTDRGVKASSRRQNGCSVVPEHPHVGPHGQNRASLLMNPMYSIARTRQCPHKSCSPRQPMAAYMWNGLQPVTSFTLIPNPNPNNNQGTRGNQKSNRSSDPVNQKWHRMNLWVTANDYKKTGREMVQFNIRGIARLPPSCGSYTSNWGTATRILVINQFG